MRRGYLVLVGSLLACGDAEPSKPSEAPRADPIVEAAPPSPRDQIVGRWRMIAEEPADGEEGIYKQQRRLLSIQADGGFVAENYVERLEGQWQLEARELTLGERRAELVEVSDERLVLIEDVPEIYLRGGPPQKARITYRRISERELGPILGRELTVSTPPAGSYAGAYDYEMSKLPTMEITIDEQIEGRATLELAADNTASGCVGVARNSHSSTSKYASRDGKHHSSEREDRWLAAWRGRWSTSDDRATIEATYWWTRSCEEPEPERTAGPLELECQALAANEVLPVAALACRIVTGPNMLEQLALNPADSERAGPYTLQDEPMGHISTDPGRPWLILGAPGLHISSEDDRRSSTPTLSFTAEPVDFVEQDYIESREL